MFYHRYLSLLLDIVKKSQLIIYSINYLEQERQKGKEKALIFVAIGLLLLFVLILKQFKSMYNQLGDILHHEQIKELINGLAQLSIDDFCSTLWYRQDEKLQKLNMQLHVNALMKNDEYILEQCVTMDKFKPMIYDLIVSSTWKKQVLPHIRIEKANSLKLHFAIYHQVVVCNILQVLMFHRTAIDESGDFLIELIDYCYQKISKQVADRIKFKKLEREKQKSSKAQLTAQQKKNIKIKQIMNRSPSEDLNRQVEQFEFALFIMSISILRYVTDYIKHLEIGIVHHLLAQCNIYSLLVPLIEQRPWMRTNEKGERQVYQNNKWVVVRKSQYGKLPNTEAQVWIAIYNLFMDPQCRKKYQLNDQRKNTLLRLRKYLNEVLLDQIPQLSHLLRSLEQLSLMNVPTHLTINPFVVQQMPIIAGGISKGKNWKQIAQEHTERLSQSIDQSEREHINRLADLYTNNTVEGLLEGFKCKKCGKSAAKRCAKCKIVWYCSRDCQVSNWPDHKAACNKRAQELKQAEVNSKTIKTVQQVVKGPQIDELD